MKFLSKTLSSEIFKGNLIYSSNSKINARIKELLLIEQKNFCAYTEEYITSTIATEVEHFNSSLKYNDDNYYNYYAVTRTSNLIKKKKERENDFLNASRNKSGFFGSRFFQNRQEFESRISFNREDKFYYSINENDDEAKSLIEYLSFNHPNLVEDRKKHINRLNETLSKFDNDNEKIEYFRRHKTELRFITAVELEFNLNLNELL